MSFTGKLGSSSSQLGSIELGHGSTSSSNSVTIDGIAATTTTHTLTVPLTITVGGFSASDPTNVSQMGSVISLDAIAAIAISTTFVGVSLSIDGTSGTSTTLQLAIGPTSSIDGVAAFDHVLNLITNVSSSINGFADVSKTIDLAIHVTSTVNAVADFSQLPGANTTSSLSIDGVASVTQLLGLIYSKSLSVNATASIGVSILVRVAGTLVVGGIASVGLNVISKYQKTLTVGGFSKFTSPGGVNYPKTLTVAGFSALVSPGGLRYVTSLSIDGVSSTTELDGTGYFKTLSVDAVSNLVTAGGFPGPVLLTIAGFSALSNSVKVAWAPIVTLASVGAVTDIVGGLLLFDQKELLATSDVLGLPGFSYSPDPVSIDGIADVAGIEEYIKNLTLTIDAVSDVAQDDSYVANANLSIAGIASVTVISVIDFVLTLTISAGSHVSIENYYNILYDLNVVASIVVSMGFYSNKTENPSGHASVSVAATGIFRRTVSQVLALTQTAKYKKPTAISSQTLTLTQVVTYVKNHFESVSQTLALTQDVQSSRPATDTLEISQTVTVTKVHFESVTQTLELTQSGDRNTVLNLSVDQTLVFNQPRQITAPMISAQGGGGQTTFQYNQPLVNVVLRPRKCLVILGVPEKTIVLPCPIFGDSQSYTGQLSLKKTMTGDTFTYIKRTTTEKLKYAFTLGTYKALELREFLIGHAHELITLHNWKGETWYVLLTNNPFEFTHAARWQPLGERVDITLEFEGIKT